MSTTRTPQVQYDSQIYGGSHVNQNQLGQRLLTLFQQHKNLLPNKETPCILDVGCGNGDLTLQLLAQNQAAHVVGIDISEDQINAAKHAYKLYEQQLQKGVSYGKATFEIADILEYKSDCKYDAVISNFAMHWALEKRNGRIVTPIAQNRGPLKAYQLIYNALKPGGYAFVQQGCVEGFAGLHAIVRDCISSLNMKQRIEPSTEFPKWSPNLSEYEATVKQAGFEVVECKLYDDTSQIQQESIANDFVAASLLFYREMADPPLSNAEYGRLQQHFLRTCQVRIAAHEPNIFEDHNILALLRKPTRSKPVVI